MSHINLRVHECKVCRRFRTLIKQGSEPYRPNTRRHCEPPTRCSIKKYLRGRGNLPIELRNDQPIWMLRAFELIHITSYLIHRFVSGSGDCHVRQVDSFGCCYHEGGLAMTSSDERLLFAMTSSSDVRVRNLSKTPNRSHCYPNSFYGCSLRTCTKILHPCIINIRLGRTPVITIGKTANNIFL